MLRVQIEHKQIQIVSCWLCCLFTNFPDWGKRRGGFLILTSEVKRMKNDTSWTNRRLD